MQFYVNYTNTRKDTTKTEPSNYTTNDERTDTTEKEPSIFIIDELHIIGGQGGPILEVNVSSNYTNARTDYKKQT
jgi:hypothetical protein